MRLISKLLVAGAMAVAPFTAAGAADKPETVTIGYLNLVNAQLVTKALGYHEKEMAGSKVKFIKVGGGGFVFNVVLQGGTPGAYLGQATALLQLADLFQSLVKAGVFGFIAGVVACTRGMTCEKGPVGVGRAVNRAVVQTFVLVFAANYVISVLYLAVVPQKI